MRRLSSINGNMITGVEGVFNMEMTIPWETDIRLALKKARVEHKPVLLYFFNPDSIGCRQMETGTYSD